MSVDPQVVLGKARAGHETVAATLRYEGGASQVAFTSGKAPTHGQIRTIDLGRGWTVDTAGVRLPGGILSGGGPTAILLAGSAFSTLLSALVLLLATGRARALRLVALKSKQLQHQALHDSLTGLPNRALILDRVDLALAQSKRYGTPLAAMFLDLDGFKSINDTHGHAVGDELLRQVGTRLTEATRDADTVGRLGGDEFVVLVQDASLSMGPEAIAERIRASVAEPFVIESEGRLTLQVHASIGIASGFRPSGGELLRDADIALYEAKASGKNRYVLFAPQMRLAAAQASRGDISVPQQGRVERRTTV
jgi:diguanylate cyclase (GGDEF)-like protein